MKPSSLEKPEAKHWVQVGGIKKSNKKVQKQVICKEMSKGNTQPKSVPHRYISYLWKTQSKEIKKPNDNCDV